MVFTSARAGGGTALGGIGQGGQYVANGLRGTSASGRKSGVSEAETAQKNSGETVGLIANLRNSIPNLSTKPVSVVSTQSLANVEGNTMADKARKLFEGIKGVVSRKGFGDVEINARAVKDDLSHGVGPAKASVIPAIPAVIQQGTQIDYQEKWKGRPYDGYVFAAPIMMDGNTVYVAAVVKKTSKNRLYLHEVVDSNGNVIKIDNGENTNQTSLAAKSDAGVQSPLPTNIVSAFLPEVNGKSAPYADALRDLPQRNPQSPTPYTDAFRDLFEDFGKKGK